MKHCCASMTPAVLATFSTLAPCAKAGTTTSPSAPRPNPRLVSMPRLLALKSHVDRALLGRVLGHPVQHALLDAPQDGGEHDPDHRQHDEHREAAAGVHLRPHLLDQHAQPG